MQVCLPKMREGKLDGQYLACWVRQGPCDEENSLKAIDRVDELIRHIYRQVEMNGEQCAIARTPDDLSRLKTEAKESFLYWHRKRIRHRQGFEEYHPFP